MKTPQVFSIKGMNQDLSPLQMPTEFSFKNLNIRLLATDDNTTLSIVNEKGNTEVFDVDGNPLFEGTPIGVIETPDCEDSLETGVTKNGFVIFTTYKETKTQTDEQGNNVVIGTKIDRIYLITEYPIETLNSKLLYEGNLNFDVEHPIEGIYDANIGSRKIYWTDNYNVVRSMLIDKSEFPKGDEDNLSFVTDTIDVDVSIKRIDSGGLFRSGVHQYIITLFTKYGAESSVLYVSPLLYIAQQDRGVSPEDNVTCSYNITVDLKTEYKDYWVAIYSIHRSELDGVPEAQLVRQVEIPEGQTIINVLDTGLTNTNIEASELLFKDSYEVKCKTLNHKDNTLFLGGLTIHNENLLTDDNYYLISNNKDSIAIRSTLYEQDMIKDKWPEFTDFGESATHRVKIGDLSDTYPYHNQLLSPARYLKSGEEYRIGLQFKNKHGKWSEPVYLKDFIANEFPKTSFINDSYQVYADLPKFYIDLFDYDYYANDPNNLYPKNLNQQNKEWLLKYKELGFISVRPVIVFPELYRRRILCQGMLQYTVSSVNDLVNNTAHCQSLWLARPTFNKGYNQGKTGHFTFQSLKESKIVVSNTQIADQPFQYIGTYGSMNGKPGGLPEIQTSYAGPAGSAPAANYNIVSGHERGPEGVNEEYKEFFFLQPEIITFHSPDIEMGTELHSAELSDYNINVVGYHVVNSYYTNINITTSTGPNPVQEGPVAAGFLYHKFEKASTSLNYINGSNTIKTGDTWDGIDDMNALVAFYYEGAGKDTTRPNVTTRYRVYPSIYLWHGSGSITGDVTTAESASVSSILQSKKTLWASSSLRTVYTKEGIVKEVADIQLYKDDGNPLVTLKIGTDSRYYYGQVDTAVMPTFGTGDLWYENRSDTDPKRRNTKKFGYPVLGTTANTIGGSAPVSAISNTGMLISSGVEYGATQRPGYSNVYSIQDLIKINLEGTRESLTEGKMFQDRYENDQYGYMTPQLPALPPYKKVTEEISDFKGKTSAKQINSFKTNPVLMKYKSSPHLVMALPKGSFLMQGKFWGTSDDDSNKRWVNPLELYQKTGTEYLTTGSSVSVNYGKASNGVPPKDYIPVKNTVVMVDLRRKNIAEGESIFQGSTRQELQILDWQPCGKEVKIDDLLEEVLYAEKDMYGKTWYRPKTVIVINDGDTYFQRYDCLKTYPYSDEDENALVNIHSFMCESRINMDGRYDRNRGTDNLATNPSIFNLINPVYSQKNNFYQYRVSLEGKKSEWESYPTQITWSKTKLPNSYIDTWTNITMASALQVDGNKGPISKIQRFKNKLYVFQDTGIATIDYNEKQLLQSAEGVPIEISNSGKVTGTTYISNIYGCNNKHAIVSLDEGIFFIDSKQRSLMAMSELDNNKASVVNVSNEKMSSWFYKQNYTKDWNPVNFDNFILQYDPINKEILIVSKDDCLSYNMILQQFSSFYSYNNVPYFIPLNNNYYAIKGNSIYKQYSGEYNRIFRQNTPFELQLISNGNLVKTATPTDKFWDSAELISDNYNSSGVFAPADQQKPFTNIEVETNYQKSAFEQIDAKKKFNVWRINYPKDLVRSYERGQRVSGIKDRIRNPWIKLTLHNDGGSTNKTVIRSLTVNSYS